MRKRKMQLNGDQKARVLNPPLCYVAFDYRKSFYVCIPFKSLQAVREKDMGKFKSEKELINRR